MVFYTDSENVICAIGSCDRTDVTRFDDSTLDEMFKGKCLNFIFGYKYEPTYQIEYNLETNEPITDDDGNPIFSLDENGEKIVNGHSIYPYVDYNQLLFIQAEYERNILAEQNDELILMMSDMIGGVE